MFSWNENNTSSFEESAQRPLMDIPVVFTLADKRYSLAATILFAPPVNETGLGHYSAAVRFDNKFEVFDDLKAKTYKLNSTTPVCVHSLLYVSSK